MFYCFVSRNILNTFYFRSGEKCCCTVICRHGSFYWLFSSWFGKNGFEKEINFMIRISNLTKKYGETVVFSNLNYTFENTCIYGLVGRNGAGKTTFLNILCKSVIGMLLLLLPMICYWMAYKIELFIIILWIWIPIQSIIIY